MPVNTQHAEYIKHAPMWAKTRRVMAGQTAIHAAGDTDLPRLSGETDLKFAARVARAPFFNATSRTVYALVGMLFRKPAEFKISAGAEAMLADVTQTGKALEDLAKLAAVEALSIGRIGLMVDYPRTGAAGLTVKQVEASGLRPKIAVYKAESIWNWARAWNGNRYVTSLVVLQEFITRANPEDEFAPFCDEQFRVLDLDPRPTLEGKPNPNFNFYRQRVFSKDEKGAFGQTDEFYPVMGGANMPEVPFVIVGVDTTEPDVEEPPIADLVHVNISHYHTTADVEHGAHKTALPQPWATGLDFEKGVDEFGPCRNTPSFTIGGDELWIAPEAGAQFGMLEYTGQGLQALETRLVRKEAYMAVLGARMLEDQKKGVETAEVAGMHRSGEQATLSSQGDTLDAGITRALSWFDKWAGGSGEVSYKTNREFLPAGLSAQDITALVGAWQQGTLTDEELFEKFQKGGVVRDDKEFEQHQTEIANAPPRLLAPPPSASTTPGAPTV